MSTVIWRKASKSHEEGDACIEVASTLEVIMIRDSKDVDGPKISMARGDFRRLAEMIRSL